MTTVLIRNIEFKLLQLRFEAEDAKLYERLKRLNVSPVGEVHAGKIGNLQLPACRWKIGLKKPQITSNNLK